ncbi:MAG: hypothetical protein ACC645_08990 [Pirellulales bacterium]
MNPDSTSDSQSVLILVRRRRWLVGVGALLLCSCQAMPPQAGQPNGFAAGTPNGTEPQAAASAMVQHQPMPQAAAAAQYPTRTVSDEPPVAGHDPHGTAADSPQSPFARHPLPLSPSPLVTPSPYPPPGSQGPFPPEEYIYDGGDRPVGVSVAADWTVYGVDPEDTVVHYDTRQGETRVQPSNRIRIYAPRFAAVRRVSSVLQHEQHQRGAACNMPLKLGVSGAAELATTVLQPVQLKGERAVKFGQTFRERTRTVGLENAQMPAETEDQLLPFEDFLIIRDGQFDNSEKARLSMRLEAAITWTHEKSVQVVIDNIAAVEASNDAEPQSVYTYEMPAGKPRVRVVKIASRQDALPGELIEFTLRFDNVGDDVIGNVTVIDNLTTRLEYVPESQQCSLDADFIEEANDAESLMLRWEITEPLKVGEGGLIRFNCRVR